MILNTAQFFANFSGVVDRIKYGNLVLNLICGLYKTLKLTINAGIIQIKYHLCS